MPLPALDLDTRRWDDLVEEARSLIPRLAPGWTDHNLHDPGVTLLELLAYVVEQDIYRVNRVPERHRRKFLRLAGFAPAPPRAASGVAAFALRDGAAPLALPAGLAVGSPDVRLRLRDTLTVSRARIAAVQSFDGTGFVDLTRSWRGGQPVAALGTEPGVADRHPALLIGFDQSLPVGTAATLWLAFGGRVARERERIAAELGAAGREHHSLRTIWEYHDGTDWRALKPQAGEVDDATRALSLDGAVRVALPSPMIPSVQGVFDTAQCWLRCRVLAGAPDVPPRLTALAVNAVAVEQRSAARQTFTLAPGPALPGTVMPGSRGRLHLDLDADGAVTALLFGPAVDGPEVLVLEHAPRTPVRAGALTVTLVLAGRGTGEPRQCLELPEGIVADDAPTVWTDVPWAAREDLDAAQRSDAVFRLEPAASLLCFGDGERGRVVAAGTPVLAAYDLTDGSAGNGRPAAPWVVAGVDDAWNESLLGAPAATVEAAVTVAPLVAPAGGAVAETTAGAAGRAVASLWAHERLLELCPPGGPQTLDQVARGRVLERIAPQRASTLLDFERIALDVTGVEVRRARAWAGLDPRDPCLRAPGTVTVVVVAGEPQSHPQPDAGLLAAVRGHLDRRRVIGTRLRVVGPAYADVRVQARVQASGTVAAAGLAARVARALDRFLDPLVGGPAETGWPFGRDVYRSEILQQIAAVGGVEHVLELTLRGGGECGGCDNVCVAATALVRAGAHQIEVAA